MTRLFATGLIVVAALSAAPAMAQTPTDGVVFPPGSRVGMIPFAGGAPASGFQGFLDEKTKRSVMIVEMPQEASSMPLESFVSAEGMKEAGVTQVARRNFEIADGANKIKAIEVRATQSAAGRTFPKCMVVFHASDFTALISAQMPDDAKGDACALIKGLTVRSALNQDQILAALPFRLTDLGGLKPWMAIGGSGVMLTDTPDGKPADDATTVVVARALADRAVPPGEMLAFSERSLAATDDVGSLPISSKRMISGSKVPTSEVMAGDKDRRVVQWIQFHPDGYTVRMIAEASTAKFDANLGNFAKIRDGIVVK